MIASLLKSLVLFHPAILPYYFMLTIDVAEAPREFLVAPDSSVVLESSANAVWLEHLWLQEGVPDAQIMALCKILNRYEIRYVYPHLTPLNEEGNLPPFSLDAVRRFKMILHRESPQIEILPWIGGVRFGFRQVRSGTVRLDSDSYLQTLGGECVYLTDQLGFDGVHLNVEPIDSGNRRFLEWLEYIQSRVGPGKKLSVAANKPSFIDGLDPGALRSWDLQYFLQVGSYCDQLVIMNYDTGISDPVLYSLFTREKLSSILKSFAEKKLSCKILLGAATYDNAPRHFAKAENLTTAVQGLLPVLADKNTPSTNFSGIAIYGYWTTSESEWNDFSRYWLSKPSR
jgi:hypothetical protein